MNFGEHILVIEQRLQRLTKRLAELPEAERRSGIDALKLCMQDSFKSLEFKIAEIERRLSAQD